MAIMSKIEEIRKSREISIYKIEKETGISQSTYKSWVKGTEPGIEKMAILLKYFAVSADELLGLKTADQNLFELNGEEEYLIEMFRKCNDAGKITVREIAAFEASRANLFGYPAADEELRAN